MAIDASIINNLRPVQIEDPTTMLAKGLALRGQVQHQQLGQQELQQRQMAIEQTKALNDAYRGALTVGPDGTASIDSGKLTNALGASGHGSAIPGVLKSVNEFQQAAANLAKTKGEVTAQLQDLGGSLGSTVKAANNDPHLFLTMAQHAIESGAIDKQMGGEYVQHVQQLLSQDPTGEQARAAVGQISDQLIARSPGQQKLINEAMTSKARESEAKTASDKFNTERPGIQATALTKGLEAAGQTVATVTDQGSWDAWRATLPPEIQSKVPPMYSDAAKAAVQLQGVATDKQPEFQIQSATASALKKMTRGDWQTAIDSTIKDQASPLYQRTAAAVNLALNRGDLKGAQAAIKDAGDQLGRTETAIATAKATAPIKIDIAAQTAAAKADQAGLTEDDYQRAGEQYARTGTMPAMGRDSITRGKIVHAAQNWARDNGLKPADVVTMQAAYAGDKDSLKKFQAQRDQIVSFEQTAQKNLDLFLDAASKIPDSGSPWLNMPLRNLDQKLVGSANMAAVNAARQVANNEIAKVTSGGGLGGVLSDAARREVENYNPSNATFAQTLAVAKVLKQDMANRHQSMDATIGDIKSRIGGGGNTGGAAQSQATPAKPTFKVGDTVMYNGAPHKVTGVKPDGKLTLDGNQ